MKSPAKGKKGAEFSGTHLWLVLMKAHRALKKLAIQSIESLGAGLSDFGVMELLLHKGPQPVNEIGRRIELTSGAITTAVDRLEARGLVARGAHATDRRARIVRLTPEGEKQSAKLFGGHKGAMDLAASRLSKAERMQLIELLEKLGAAAEDAASTTQITGGETEIRRIGRQLRAEGKRSYALEAFDD
jgi:MarR family transcriptional regulator, 2-MHQ and catechol-resistance regulon repressor